MRRYSQAQAPALPSLKSEKGVFGWETCHRIMTVKSKGRTPVVQRQRWAEVDITCKNVIPVCERATEHCGHSVTLKIPIFSGRGC